MAKIAIRKFDSNYRDVYTTLRASIASGLELVKDQRGIKNEPIPLEMYPVIHQAAYELAKIFYEEFSEVDDDDVDE